MTKSATPTGTVLILMLLLVAQFALMTPALAEPSDPKLSNDRCLRCHGKDGFSKEDAFGRERDLHVTADVFGGSVHGRQDCVGCHEDIVKVPHRKGIVRKVGCVQCHMNEWGKAQENGAAANGAKLDKVVDHIQSYMDSMHARPRIDDQSHTNATCYNCHGSHDVKPVDREERSENYLNFPNKCGTCHSDVLELYKTSVHGKEWSEGNASAAVCADCHSRHGVGAPHTADGRVEIAANCGNCHQDMMESYLETYHGKITKLGYGETAKCYDCHGSHQIQRVDNPASSVYPDNRLKTCQKCHEGATKGFLTFQPHGNSHDFEKYPQMWLATNFMIGLLLGTFAFFWLHSALWFYREYMDRKQGKNRPHIMTEAIPAGGKTHFRRFTRWWRLAHLVGAVSIMTLALTGLTVLYAESSWAPYIMKFLGGPETAGYIHRAGAIGFMSVFFIHLIYFAIHIGRNWRTFEWFGPNSLVPNWNDLGDAIAMFRWFFGLAPRPDLDRYSYWEKFDYWAPFWGMTIIGVSGLIMWYPVFWAEFLPGWAFNVASIVHGEEAFLAVVFLFTVHFFNNHFRPDKFPQNTTMFTGRVPLEEYKHEHRREYERLRASGELDKYLVYAPTEPQAKSASLLGATLITFGLFLLTLVFLGFFGV